MLDRATVEANYRRFLERSVASEAVWYLGDGNGNTAYAETNSDAVPAGTVVLLFWSDEAYARRAAKATFHDYVPEKIDLIELIYQWLPGMHEDGALAGVNWTADLIGLESAPLALLDDVRAAMGAELVQRYEARFATAVERRGNPQ